DGRPDAAGDRGAAMRRLALAAALYAAAGPALAADCGAPTKMADGWPVAAPRREGLDPRLICAIGPRLESLKGADPNGVLVVRHGRLVYEHYFTGEDKLWREPLAVVAHDARTLHRIESITKSLVAILAGIALDRRLLAGVDVRALPFFPEDADLGTPEKAAITVRNLLSMTSGIAWPEAASSYNDAANINRRRIFAEPDPDRFVLQQPMAAKPGTVWTYSGGGVGLLASILQKATRRRLDVFARETLFGPLGIADWKWWPLASGDPSASGGLFLRPRDLAKIGQLVLAGGVWHGRRIVSARWIAEMTSPQLPHGYPFGFGGAYSYGYLWWLGRSLVEGRQIAWVGGIGWGGQRLFVVPSLDLVVVATAGLYHRSATQFAAADTAFDMALRAAVRRPGWAAGPAWAR
ncbi:MAG TPA: serine hydrolase, partial [Stellaceae bacterium]|nr:serine hydrolase [Stellaceae bacterium]